MKRTQKRYCLLSLLLVTWVIPLFGQRQTSIKVIGVATNHSIRLRWAPTTAKAWQLNNKYGYTVERKKLVERGTVMTNQPPKILTPKPLKPAEPAMWQSSMVTDDNAAIAAQAVFGDEFTPKVEHDKSISSIVNRATELDSRFSFALFAADHSLKAAELLGLFLEDETVEPGCKYVYRVFGNVPQGVPSDTASVYIGLDDFKSLPAVMDVETEFSEMTVQVSWNAAYVERIYNSFHLERSEDSNAFEKINQSPIVTAFPGERSPARLFRFDSLKSSQKKYCYRVRGVTAFAEVGPPSKPSCGKSLTAFSAKASIIGHAVDSNGIRLFWNARSANGVISVDLLRSEKGDYLPVKKNLSIRDTVITDDTPRATNYYIIRLQAADGRTASSFPYLVQVEDSIPPLPPTQLTGHIDSVGHVSISWRHNAELDLLGYSVFRANFLSDEFIQLPGRVLSDTTFSDSVASATLTEFIYYRVAAVDNRFNVSQLSVPLALKKPDLVPPASPLLISVRSDSSGVLVAWQRSLASDVVRHQIFRRAEFENGWALVFESPGNDSVYIDKHLPHSGKYSYTAIAIDDDGLESRPCQPLSVMYTRNNIDLQLRLWYTVSHDRQTVQISWNADTREVRAVLIYRRTDDQPLRFVRSIPSSQTTFEEPLAVNRRSVQYRILALLNDGSRSKMSDALTINR